MATDADSEPVSTLRRCRTAACDIAAAESRTDLFERTVEAAEELFGLGDVRLCAVDLSGESLTVEHAAGPDATDGVDDGADGDSVGAPDATPDAAVAAEAIEDEVAVAVPTDDPNAATAIVVPVDDDHVLCLRSDAAVDVSDEETALAGLIGQSFATTFDRLEHAAALDDRESALARKDERLDRFAGLVAHEFRNPIGIASGHLDLVVGTDGDERHLEAVRDAVDRMDRLTESLLDLVRGEPLSGNVEAVDLGYLAKDVFETVCPSSTTLTIDDRVTVRANERRLRTALESLFSDAVTRGDAAVEIRIGALDAAGFYVADDGSKSGRDVDVDPFGYRPANETDRRDLRLAIVHDVAAAHGWHVDVARDTDSGVRVEFETAN
ncbi:sensor histidine kinase [Halobellus sp. Atlit-31R]|nr:sensor histidine kinase [Halobellus sp. Atlit-31R]